MSEMAMRAADYLDALPEEDKELAFIFIEKLIYAWNPDFTKLTPKEKEEPAEAEAAIACGEYVTDNEIDWGD